MRALRRPFGPHRAPPIKPNAEVLGYWRISLWDKIMRAECGFTTKASCLEPCSGFAGLAD